MRSNMQLALHHWVNCTSVDSNSKERTANTMFLLLLFQVANFVSFSLKKTERIPCLILHFPCFFLDINKVLWTEKKKQTLTPDSTTRYDLCEFRLRRRTVLNTGSRVKNKQLNFQVGLIKYLLCLLFLSIYSQSHYCPVEKYRKHL